MNNGKLCISICAKTAREMIENIHRAEKFADVIEVRFDCLAVTEIDNLKSQIKNLKFERPLIATYRSSDEGGRSAAELDERREFWSGPPDPMFSAADIESDLGDAAAHWPLRIVSFHSFGTDLVDLENLFEQLSGVESDVIKIAVHAADAADAIPAWNLIEKAKISEREIIPIAMGEAGKWTRILGLAHGAYLTYASLDEGRETADGQIPATEMLEIYRVKALDDETQVYGVIGDPISGSLSPYMHNAAFADVALNAVFVPLQVKDLDTFMTRMVQPATREVELKFAGFAVTMPHKQNVMKYLDEIDDTAAKIGSVNTVTIENGKLSGHNTDCHGFIVPLTAMFGDLTGARVAVLGAGGAARACVYELKRSNAKVTVFSRDSAKGEAFASEFDVEADAFSNLSSQISDFELLVNATPLGMDSATPSPLTAEHLKGVKLVFDLVTGSTDTPLIQEAKQAGILTIGGLEMLTAQGAKQFELWTGCEAPIALMRAAAMKKMEKSK